ncbi:MAG: SWIM zinc finger domain-containing protein [Anaerolineae bacterium]|nr:SWIM zinc finger domain-containing protein [Anaerolineae bacterium]
MPSPIFSEDMLRRHTTAESFARGEQYYTRKTVRDPVRRGATLEAQVEGSQFTPYRVTITLDEAGIRSASCTCPYHFGGYCKHVVAVLLTYIRQPETFAEQPELSEPLESLPAEQLRKLIRTLLDQKPELNDWFHVMISSLAPVSQPETQPVQRSPVDVTAFRRQIKHAIGQIDYGRHWETIWAVVGDLEAAHNQAKAFLHGGDSANALALMRVLGEEVIPNYENLEEECQLAEFLEIWSDDLTEAILGANLSPDEQKELSRQLTRWAGPLSDFGLDETLDKPITACERGWDAPSDDLDDEFAIDLIDAKLNVLERQGDTEAYLQSCLENGAHYRYARRLAELGQIEQATGHALQHAMEANEFLKLAQFLREQGHIEAAYQVGLRGLSGEGRKYEVGQWTGEFAESLGRLDIAQQAWHAAFDSSPSLEAYQQLKRLSGDDWPNLHPQLMERLRQDAYRTVLIDILIDDQAIEEAIQVWDSYPYWGYDLLGRLVDAAGADHPDWAIQHALNEAQGLIAKASTYYPHAVRWLGKVKQIYLQHDRSGDWQQCITSIRAQHGRKYSLMAQLKQLD